MRLVYDHSNIPVEVGDKVVTSKGYSGTVISMTEPHKPSSTGRVVVQLAGADSHSEFYPSVINATWIERDDRYRVGD